MLFIYAYAVERRGAINGSMRPVVVGVADGDVVICLVPYLYGGGGGGSRLPREVWFAFASRLSAQTLAQDRSLRRSLVWTGCGGRLRRWFLVCRGRCRRRVSGRIVAWEEEKGCAGRSVWSFRFSRVRREEAVASRPSRAVLLVGLA